MAWLHCRRSRSRARFLGSTDHTPNNPKRHFDDFSSYHTGGAHFIFGECATKMISNNKQLDIYQGFATRSGGEVPGSLE